MIDHEAKKTYFRRKFCEYLVIDFGFSASDFNQKTKTDEDQDQKSKTVIL